MLHLRPSGVLWYGTAQKLDDRFIALLAENPDAEQLEIHLLGLGRIDLTGALALKKVISDAKRAGLIVEVGPVPAVAADLLGRVLPETAVTATLTGAAQVARRQRGAQARAPRARPRTRTALRARAPRSGRAASITTPPTAVPSEIPVTIAVLSHENASVVVPGTASRSTSP